MGFKNTDTAPCELEPLLQEYCKLTNQPYPIPEMVFANSWMLFRASCFQCFDVQLLSLAPYSWL